MPAALQRCQQVVAVAVIQADTANAETIDTLQQQPELEGLNNPQHTTNAQRVHVHFH
jgi:hypothetical protein